MPSKAEDLVKRAADDYLAAHPEVRTELERSFETFAAGFVKRGATPPMTQEEFVRTQATARAMMARIGAKMPMVGPRDVAGSFGGKLPTGWDDLLPPEKIRKQE